MAELWPKPASEKSTFGEIYSGTTLQFSETSNGRKIARMDPISTMFCQKRLQRRDLFFRKILRAAVVEKLYENVEKLYETRRTKIEKL